MAAGIPDEHVGWLDLKRLSSYACVSEQTLRRWIHSANDPLPAFQRGTKIYVRKVEFDAWMQHHAFRSKTLSDINRLVDDILGDIARDQGRSVG